jgi:hypothetical protein
MLSYLTLVDIYQSRSFEQTLRNERVNGADFNLTHDGEETLLEQSIQEGPYQSIPIALTLIKYGAILTADMIYRAEKKYRNYKLGTRLTYHLSLAEYTKYLIRHLYSEDVCNHSHDVIEIAAKWGRDREKYLNSHFPESPDDSDDTLIYKDRMRGVDYNAPMPLEDTDEVVIPLKHAINGGQVEAVVALILHGANVTQEIFDYCEEIIPSGDGKHWEKHWEIYSVLSFNFKRYYEIYLNDDEVEEDAKQEWVYDYNNYKTELMRKGAKKEQLE